MERVVSYEPKFDRVLYEKSNPRDRERLDNYTRKQIETHLGERFNVLLSPTRYEIKEGLIYGENTNEPFMQMLQRGVEYRRKHGNPIDFEREEAEVVGFRKIQESLASEESKEGAMMLLISPPGGEESIYKHNFYDVFTLKKDEKGKYIEAIRYSSALTIKEYRERLGILKEFDSAPRDVDFLKDPILVNKDIFSSSDQMHAYLHKNHEYITREELDEILKMTASLEISYVNALWQNAHDENLQLLHLNAIMNKADVGLSLIKHGDRENLVRQYVIQSGFSVNSDINNLGMQPVRIVSTGCGSSGGFSVNKMLNAASSPFSVSEFGKSQGNQEWFSCPKCTYKADGPVGNKCPGCGLTKEKFTQEGGESCE